MGKYLRGDFGWQSLYWIEVEECGYLFHDGGNGRRSQRSQDFKRNICGGRG